MLDDKAIEQHMQSTKPMSGEQMVALLTSGDTIEGDTPVPGESDQTPEVAAAPEKVEEKPEVKAEEPDGSVKPEVLAKDGKHTIPYEELETAREQAKYWEQVARDNAAIAASLREAKAADAETGTTEAQDELIASLEKDFPEIAEAVQKLVDSRMAVFEKRVDEAIAPVKKSAETASGDAHFDTFKGAHSDFDAGRAR